MLKDNEPVTDDVIGDILLRLKAFLDESKMPVAELARSMDINQTVISELRNKKYKGDAERMYRRMSKWLDEEAPNKLASLHRKSSQSGRFVITRVAEDIFDYASAAKNRGIMVYYAAPSGAGKTEACKALARQTIGSVYVCCRTRVDTPLAFFRQVGAAVNANMFCRTGYNDLFDRLVESLRGTGRLLIVDQVHKLLDRRDDSALLALGDLHEETECPILLVGTNSVLNHLKTYGGTRDPVEQLDSRIKLRHDLTPKFLTMLTGPGGKKIFTPKQLDEMYQRRGVHFDGEGLKMITKIANNERGHLRIVDAIIDAICLTEGSVRGVLDIPITAKMITDAFPHVRGQVYVPKDDEHEAFDARQVG